MRRIGIFLFFLMISLRAFSLDISAGFGGTFQYDVAFMEVDFPGAGSKGTSSIPNLGFGVFFDLHYLLVDCSIAYSLDGTLINETPSGTTEETIGDFYTTFSLQGFLKYPIQLGSIRLFPAAGMEYRKVLEALDENGNDMREAMAIAGDSLVEQWHVKGGLGVDIPLNEIFFLRGLALFAYKLPGDYETEFISEMEALGASASVMNLGFSSSLYLGYSY